MDFATIFEEHLKPFESRYDEAKGISTGLWREYSAMSNRLDFLPLDSDEYKTLDTLCDAQKAEYDTAHAQTDYLYNAFRRMLTEEDITALLPENWQPVTAK